MNERPHEEKFNVQSTCRTCLESISEVQLDIFTIPEFQTKFTLCTSLPIEINDGFPTCLCESCHTKINDVYKFQQMCISSRRRFQEFIKSTENSSTNLFSSMELKEDNESMDQSLIFFDDIKEESDDDQPIVKYRYREKEILSTTNTMNEDSNTFVLLKTGQKNNSPKTKLNCEICDKEFRKLEHFENHMSTHKGVKPFQCQQCDKSYERKGRLEVHLRIKHDGKSFPSTEEECNKALSSKQTLNSDIAEVHGSSNGNNTTKTKQLYICEECGKALKGLSTLKNHMFLHSGQPRPHACPLCHKRYMTRCKLKDHMNRHAGIKNFVCPHCGAKKSSRSELKNHVNYHTKEKTYPCHICNMVFNNIVNYSRHRRVVHEGIKNFPCSYCDKSFGKSETRKHHEMTHTGEKPHECNICHKKFIQIVSLKKHQKVHLKELGKSM